MLTPEQAEQWGRERYAVRPITEEERRMYAEAAKRMLRPEAKRYSKERLRSGCILYRLSDFHARRCF